MNANKAGLTAPSLPKIAAAMNATKATSTLTHNRFDALTVPHCPLSPLLALHPGRSGTRSDRGGMLPRAALVQPG